LSGTFEIVAPGSRVAGPISPSQRMPVERTALVMVTKLVDAAQKTWRRLDGPSQVPKLLAGVRFTGGLEAVARTGNRQPTTGAA
jgi:hypothetical protein